MPYQIIQILVQKFLRCQSNIKKLIIVGASPKPERPSYVVMEYLIKEGFEVIPVNPAHKEILGQKVYPNLESIPSDFQPEVIIFFSQK